MRLLRHLIVLLSEILSKPPNRKQFTRTKRTPMLQPMFNNSRKTCKEYNYADEQVDSSWAKKKNESSLMPRIHMSKLTKKRKKAKTGNEKKSCTIQWESYKSTQNDKIFFLSSAILGLNTTSQHLLTSRRNVQTLYTIIWAQVHHKSNNFPSFSWNANLTRRHWLILIIKILYS